jgi:hypothetical protein
VVLADLDPELPADRHPSGVFGKGQRIGAVSGSARVFPRCSLNVLCDDCNGSPAGPPGLASRGRPWGNRPARTSLPGVRWCQGINPCDCTARPRSGKRRALGRGGITELRGSTLPADYQLHSSGLSCNCPVKSLKSFYTSYVFFRPVMTGGQAQDGRREDNDPSLIEAHGGCGVGSLGGEWRK